MPATVAATPRCAACNRGLAFDEWSVGLDVCARCAGEEAQAGPAATYAPSSSRKLRQSMDQQQAELERMLDDIPGELIDELIAALEAEAAAAESQSPATAAPSPLHDILREIGANRSPREGAYAGWGFAFGFGLNVILAKSAQMSSGAPMSQIIAPLILGGLVAGITCAAIGWAIARLR